MIDPELQRSRRHRPSWVHLGGRRESAMRNHVGFRTNLLERFAVELDVRLKRSEGARVGLRAHGGEPPRVIEGPELRLRVEVGAVCGDLMIFLYDEDVSGRQQPV